MGIDFLWDGTGLDYRQGYSIAIIRLLGLIGSLFLAITITMHSIIYILTKSKHKIIYEKVDQFVDIKPSLHVVRMEIASDILFWIGIGIISLIFSLYSGFDYIPTAGAIFIIISLYSIAMVYQIFRWSLYEDVLLTFFRRWTRAAVFRKWAIITASLTLLFLSISIPFVMQRTCICYHTDAYGVPLGSFLLSTQMSRGKWLPSQVCESTSICHIYATLPSNSSNAVFINVHTGTFIQNLTSVFTLGNKNITQMCERIPFPSTIEDRGQRNVFTCVMTKLQSNSLYSVQIFNQGQVIHQTNYKTLPTRIQAMAQNFTIVFGGDFGYSDNGLNLLKQISSYNPDVILVGGDVAYDNAILHCFYSWDLMLSAFENAILPMGRLVAIVVAVGNHDVGLHSMAYSNITVSAEQGPLYFTFFPQEFLDEENQTGVLSIEHRKTYVHHLLGNFILISLDSGYLYDYGDPQTSWLNSTLANNYANYRPIVQYHNPMFPSCFVNGTSKDNARQLKQSKDVWLPLFDQYGVLAAFENHVHQFKRTFPIKNGQPNTQTQEGTVFFGDGSMGVGGTFCKSPYLTNQTFYEGYFAVSENGYFDHFWVLNQFTNKSLEFTAYNSQQKVVGDSFYQIDLSKKIDL